MSRAVDGELLAERTAAVLAHLDRVATHLPDDPNDLRSMSSPTDTVIRHLWQAIQVVIDLATATCVRLGLGIPPTCGDAIRLLADAGVIDAAHGTRLARAAAFRDLLVLGYGRLDLRRVHALTRTGPDDLRAFLAALRDQV